MGNEYEGGFEEGAEMAARLARQRQRKTDAELASLRAEVERLTAALATETRAVERLAGELTAGPIESPCNARDCGDRGPDNCDGDCAACWAAWARAENEEASND